MAGIGFELKKLYNDKGLLSGVRAFLYSFAVTVGPMVLCILLITAMQFLLEKLGEDYTKRQLFVAVIEYAFIFSLFISGGMAMYLSRFFADMIYIHKYDEILHSLDLALIISLLMGTVQSLLFLYFADMELLTAVLAYGLFMILILVWVYSIIITALKNYGKIVRIYVSGVAAGGAAAIVMAMAGISNSDYYLFAVALTFAVIGSRMMYYVRGIFKNKVGVSVKAIEYMDVYGKLYIVGFCLNAGIYVQNMVYWMTPDATVVARVFRIAPFYDVPMFYAFLTVIPAMVFFVIFFETNFYDKYKEYYDKIIHGGSLPEMENAKINMIRTLYHEYSGVMEIQLFFSILFLLLGRVMLPRIGISHGSVDIFSILALGCFVYAAVYVGVMVLLYFDDVNGAVGVSLAFFLSDLFFTSISLYYDESARGLGFFMSALFTFVICYMRLNHYMKNLDYYTYCNQPLLQIKPNGVFSKLARILKKSTSEE